MLAAKANPKMAMSRTKKKMNNARMNLSRVLR